MKAACEKDAGMDIAHSGAMLNYTLLRLLWKSLTEVQIHGGNGFMWQLT
jgi:hypothetical protein